MGGRRGWVCVLRQGWLRPSRAVPARTLLPAMLVSQISTQRKINIYSILQEIIQQEGELEERCVQRLVAIASREMRDILEVEEPWAGALPSANPGAGSWSARPLSGYLKGQK